MKKEINCKECDSFLSEETICDTCGKQLSIDGQLIYEIGNVTLINLKLNSTEYDFCSYQCLLKFIVKELKKEKEK